MCKIHRKTVKNVLDNRESIRDADIAGTAIGANHSLRARYPADDNDAIEFINVPIFDCLPVTSSYIKSCAKEAAKCRRIQSFSAYNCLLLKFLRQYPVQRSFKLHGKG